jgi:hypothetical protein
MRTLKVAAFLLLAGLAWAQTVVINGGGGGSGSGITVPGTTTPGFLTTWNSSTGAALGAGVATTTFDTAGAALTAQASSQPIFTASVNQSTGAAVCNFATISGYVPICLINDNTGNTGFKNPVLPTFSNLPTATATAPVMLQFLTNMYGTTGMTWPTTGSPLVWCGGQDALQLCGGNGSQNYWSEQSPLRSGAGTQPNSYFAFSAIWNGTDIFLQGDSGLYQTVNAAHVNSNIFAAVGVSSTGGTISILFGGIENLGQNSFIATDTTSKSDTAGLITLVAGSGSYTFAGYQGGNHTGTPYCVASDTTANNPVKAAATNIALTVTGTSTDVISYICIFASN